MLICDNLLILRAKQILFDFMYRTHTCGSLRAENVNQTVTLAGWVQKVRNLGAMTFIDLRDRYGITHIVVEEHSPEAVRTSSGDCSSTTICVMP